MAFTSDGIAPPGIPLLGCSPPTTMRYRTVFGRSWLRYSCYQYACCGEKTDILALSLPIICKKTDFPANLARLPLGVRRHLHQTLPALSVHCCLTQLLE